MRRLGVAMAVGTILALLLLTAASSGPTQAGPGTSQQIVSPAGCAGHRGKLTLLRVHDVGTGYGSPSLDIEVVIRLDTEPSRAFGFQLRNDSNRPVRQGMFDILRDAFDYNWTVDVDECDGVVFRVWLSKP